MPQKPVLSFPKQSTMVDLNFKRYRPFYSGRLGWKKCRFINTNKNTQY